MTAQYPFVVQQRVADVWFTAAGQTFDEMFENACALFGEEKANEYLALAAAENVVRDAGMTPPSSPPARSASRSGPPARSGPPSGPRRSSAPSGGGGSWKDNPPQCDHGAMRPYEGTNTRGPYKAWFCSGPRELSRDEKCSPLDGLTLEPWS